MLLIHDAGDVSALRSQALWHGIAAAKRPGDPVTLSMCRPTEPYVGLGFHRRLDELDLDACDASGLRIIRRQIGGGPVYMDSRQLFFQIAMPAAQAPRSVAALYARFLSPAVEGFRALGVREAGLRGLNDIAVADRKLSGTGAGQIEGGVTVVGNVLFEFDHEAMVSVLDLPEDLRPETLAMMKRHVSSLAGEGLGHVTFDDARAALVEAYTNALGEPAVETDLSARERTAVESWEQRFTDPEWTAGPTPPPRTHHAVKICAHIGVFSTGDESLKIRGAIVDGRWQHVQASGPSVPAGLSEALGGLDVADTRATLESFPEGERVFTLLQPCIRSPR